MFFEFLNISINNLIKVKFSNSIQAFFKKFIIKNEIKENIIII
jgi:hypothetical protein